MGNLFSKSDFYEDVRTFYPEIAIVGIPQLTDDPTINQKMYPDNEVKTSQYNYWTFIFVNLFNQFKRIANAYFCFLLILQLIPQISSMNPISTIVPLGLVLAVTAVKDLTDDIRRHRADDEVNNKNMCQVLKREVDPNNPNKTIRVSWIQQAWKTVRPGDIIKITGDSSVPADFVIISSANENGIVYIETAELDGETNLKIRRSPKVFENLTESDQEMIDSQQAQLYDKFFTDSQNPVRTECDLPNNKLDKFKGNIAHKGENNSLNNDNICLRGMKVQNTEWCTGIVCYTGPDTKLMQNSGAIIWKRTHTDKLLNTLVLWIFCILIGLCLICTIGQMVWYSRYGDTFNIDGIIPAMSYSNQAWKSGALMFWSYIIIMNTLVPISLYVSVEIIRLGQSFFINWDRAMYYKPKNQAAEARTTTLNEELGQIQYIFSDKTGTLTQNIMCFKKCCINGKTYGGVFDKSGTRTRRQESKFGHAINLRDLGFKWADTEFKFYDPNLIKAVERRDEQVYNFLIAMSLNHTVNTEESVDETTNKIIGLTYKAQSPDEAALVSAAKNFGFTFKGEGDKPDTVKIEFPDGKIRQYDIMHILDFDNDRKMMTVIIRDPESGEIQVHTKGADTSVYARLADGDKEHKNATSDAMEVFAQDGLLLGCCKNYDHDFISLCHFHKTFSSTHFPHELSSTDQKLSLKKNTKPGTNNTTSLKQPSKVVKNYSRNPSNLSKPILTF